MVPAWAGNESRSARHNGAPHAMSAVASAAAAATASAAEAAAAAAASVGTAAGGGVLSSVQGVSGGGPSHGDEHECE